MASVRELIENKFFIVISISWTIIISVFISISELSRSNTLFIRLLIFPIIGYIVLVWLLERRKTILDKHDMKIFWTVTVILRLITFFFPVGLSDDIYRYLWDGHVQEIGFNPYRYSPDDPSVQEFRTPWWSNINNSDIHTPYPPFSQLIFLLIQLPTDDLDYLIFISRLFMTAFDLGVVWFILRISAILHKPNRRVIYYAWSPLAIFEFAGNAHNDVIALFFMMLTIYVTLRYEKGSQMHILGAISLGLGFLTKYFPIVLLPFVFHKWRAREYVSFIVTVLIVSGIYLDPGINPLFPTGQMLYLQYFRFNESFNRLVYLIPGDYVGSLLARNIYLFLVIMFSIYRIYQYTKSSDKNSSLIYEMSFILFFSLLIGPDVQPWYILWILPLATIVLYLPVIILGITVLLSYEVYIGFDSTGLWNENPIIVVMEYLPVFVLLILEFVYSPNRVKKVIFKSE